jgi:hypothetical protein
MRRTLQAVATSIVAVAAAAATVPLADAAVAIPASDAGLRTPARAVQTAIVTGLGMSGDPRCHAVRLARSNRNWGEVYSSRFAAQNLRTCTPYDGSTLIRKSNGKWVATDLGGSVYGCSTFAPSGGLSQAGAPASVVRDFRRAFARWCDPSY